MRKTGCFKSLLLRPSCDKNHLERSLTRTLLGSPPPVLVQQICSGTRNLHF